jgi:hypothetical protein
MAAAMTAMDARVNAMEQQLRQMRQEQQILIAFISKLGVVPTVVDGQSGLSGLKLVHDDKKTTTIEVREAVITPPESPASSVTPGTTPGTTPGSTTPKHDLDKLAGDILDVIQRYGQHLPSADSKDGQPGEWLGRKMFMGKVKAQLAKNQAIRLILPAFPWKSVNKVDKVTGILPDMGEELALYRLNQMCKEIQAVYPLGGQVCIATDGLVFDDVVGISDEDTWAYGEGLVEMAREHNLPHIKLMRVMDILGYTEGKTLDKQLYLELAGQCREELLASYGRTEEEVRQMMKDDPDTLL